MKELNVVQEIDEIKKLLCYSKRIGFFFGAGSSCAFGLPNIYTLTEKVQAGLSDELKSVYEEINKLLKEIYGEKNTSVEEVLNYVRQIKEITGERADKSYEGVSGEVAKKLEGNICELIFNILKNGEDSADISELRKFFAWLDMIDRSYSKEVFTTNYDMLLEKSMESNYIPYFDGFVGAYEPFFWPDSIEKFISPNDMTSSWIRLWKIHGSLNWKCVDDKYRGTTKIVRTAKLNKSENELFKSENELLIYPSKEKYSLSRKQPFIAYFDRLKKYMLQGEVLFIFSGYSFSDQHINDIIFNCLRQNPRVYALVLCFSDEQVDAMKDYAESYLNLCVMGPKEAIINGKHSKWTYDEENDKDDNIDIYWDESKKEFILGDFKKLINFLVISSGRKSVIGEALNGK